MNNDIIPEQLVEESKGTTRFPSSRGKKQGPSIQEEGALQESYQSFK